MAKPTPASADAEASACGCLKRAAATPWHPIVFDAGLNEYNFEFLCPRNDGGEAAKASIRIYYCPLCGRAAPESKRDSLFATIPPEEEQRLYALTADIKSVEDALRVLGEPDCDDPRAVTVEKLEQDGKTLTAQSYRVLTYSRLSDTAEVILTDYREGGLQTQLHGKYIGHPESEQGAAPDPAM